MPESVAQCPVEEAIQIIGGKWKLLILRSLLLNGPQRYNELLKAVTTISPKQLTRNLQELAAAKLLIRDSGPSGAAGYDLTNIGKGLMPTFQMLLAWGSELLLQR